MGNPVIAKVPTLWQGSFSPGQALLLSWVQRGRLACLWQHGALIPPKAAPRQASLAGCLSSSSINRGRSNASWLISHWSLVNSVRPNFIEEENVRMPDLVLEKGCSGAGADKKYPVSACRMSNCNSAILTWDFSEGKTFIFYRDSPSGADEVLEQNVLSAAPPPHLFCFH